MITDEGVAKIVDFGIAKLTKYTKLTKEGTSVGTVTYMSPEQSKGEVVDMRSDIWSLGVVLYEMITGQRPFHGDYDQAVVYSVLNEEPQPITGLRTGVPMELDRIVRKCLEKDPANRYQHVSDFGVDLKRLQNKLKDDETRVKPSRISGSKNMRRIITIVIAACVVFTSAAYLYFKIRSGTNEIGSPTTTPTGRQNTVAVMYFENLTDDSDLDIMQKSIVNLLITNLSRYKDLGVVSSQRLFDILKSVGKENDRSISKTTATRIARQANVKYMITGSILKAGEIIRVTAEISDVVTGRNMGSDQTDGSGEEDTFNIVDKMTEKVVALLGVTDSQFASQKISIIDVTTSNLEAYKHYQAGMEKKYRFDHYGASKEFEKAVLSDSTFAMGYAWMAVTQGVFQIQNPLHNLHRFRKIIQKAKQYSFHTTERERMWIQCIETLLSRDIEGYEEIIRRYTFRFPEDKMGWFHYALFLHNLLNDDRAIGCLEKVLELDPAFPDAYNILAYIHARRGEYDTAISMVKRYTALLPDAYNPYDTAFDIYNMAGKVKEAIDVCERALKINESWFSFYEKIGIGRLYQDRPEDARFMFEQLMQKDPNSEGNGYAHLGASYVYEGKFIEAANQFQRALDWYRKRENQLSAIMMGLYLAKANMTMGRFQEAETVLSETERFSEGCYVTSYNPALLLIEYLQGRGWIQRENYGQVQSAADNILSLIEEQSMDDYYRGYHHFLLAELYNKLVDRRQALSHFQQIPVTFQVNQPVSYRIQANLHTLSQEYDQAIHKYLVLSNNVESTSANYGGDLFDFFLEYARVPYALGKLYEVKGDREKAIEHYKHAVERWKHADPGMEELEDAKHRLVRLKEVL